MKNLSKISSKFITSLVILGTSLAQVALAQNPQLPTLNPLNRLKIMAELTGYSTVEVKPQVVIVEIITYLLGFVGLVFFVMILFAGWQILTSGGNEENVKKAKTRLLHAVIGLAVIIAAYAISAYILSILIKSTTSGYYSF